MDTRKLEDCWDKFYANLSESENSTIYRVSRKNVIDFISRCIDENLIPIEENITKEDEKNVYKQVFGTGYNKTLSPMSKTCQRSFSSGSIRDTDNDKIDYEGFLSPMVLQKFCEYMHKHRKMKDGTLRDSDNWQKLFGENHYDVCMKSLCRHFMDMWSEHRGLKSRDGMSDAMCGILFNAMAYMYKFYKDNP
jgi:hypothetical protein